MFATLGRTGRAQEKPETEEPPLADPPVVAKPVGVEKAPAPAVYVFVADGAGGYLKMSQAVSNAAEPSRGNRCFISLCTNKS